MSSWWNDRGHVGLGRGSRTPVDCARSHPSHRWERVLWLRAHVAHRLARGFHMSLGRGGSKLRGLGDLMMSWGLGRGGKMPPRRLSRSRPFHKARVGWSLSFVPQVTDMLSVPWWASFTGALRWGFNDRVGCRILPSVGYPSILMPDSSPRAYGGVEHSFKDLRTSDRG
jgi:hypothetical protein